MRLPNGVRICAAIIACALSYSGWSADDVPMVASDAKTEAIAAAKSGRWQDSLTSAERALESTPADDDLRQLRANALLALGRAVEAATAWDQLVAESPESSGKRTSLCWSLILANRPLDARPQCEKALTLNAGSYVTTINLGHTYLLTGDKTSARTWYRRAVPLLFSEKDLMSGPVNDFSIFEKRGWYPTEARDASEWFQERTRRWFAVLPRVLDSMKQMTVAMQGSGDVNALLVKEEALRQTLLDELGDDNIFAAITDAFGAMLEAMSGRPDEGYARALRAQALLRTVALGGKTQFDTLAKQALLSALMLMGRFNEALPLAIESEQTEEHLRGPGSPAAINGLRLLAVLYGQLGADHQALALRVDIEKREEQQFGVTDVRTVNAAGNVAAALAKVGRLDEARDAAVRALGRVPAASKESIDLLQVLAGIDTAQGRIEDAIVRETQALAAMDANPKWDDTPSATRRQLINYYILAGRAGDAEKLVVQLVRDSINDGFPLSQVRVSTVLARYYNATGRSALAIFFSKQAVNRLQSLRASTTALTPDLRNGFVNDNRRVYEDLSAWLIAAGRLTEAEAVQAMLKDYEYQQITRGEVSRTRDRAATMTDAESRIAAEWASLVAEGAELAGLERQRDQADGVVSDARETRFQQLRERQVAWDTSLARFLQNLQPALSTDANSARKTRVFVEKETTAFRSLIDRSNRLSGVAHLGLLYVVTEDAVSIIVTSGQGAFARRVAIKRSDLRNRIEAMRKVVSHSNEDPRAAAGALYDILIKPVEDALGKFKPSVVVLNLDDTMRYVPFGALFDGKQYLVERYAVAIYASQGFHGVRSRSPLGWSAAGLGATIGTRVDDARYDALPRVADEVAAVVRTASTPHGAFPGEIALDGAFTRKKLEQELARARQGRAQLVHIASHFYLSPSNDNGSYLILGDGAPLRLSNIKTLTFDGVELLTLSACDTATPGQPNANGSEVEGLASIAQEKGAETVLGSLWKIDDVGSEAFMKRFYALFRTGRMTSAIAVQRAQLDMLNLGRTNGHVKPAGRAQLRFSHPYYWAPFILTGNWL